MGEHSSLTAVFVSNLNTIIEPNDANFTWIRTRAPLVTFARVVAGST